jgi:phosphonate transport system substrate-binding protein
MQRVLAALLALAAPAVLADTHCLGDRAARAVLQISVVPQFAPTVVHARWAPLLERIGQQTGHCFRLHVTASIPEFERDLLRGEPDLAFVNPYHAVLARRAKGYVPLVRDDRQFLSGVVIVRGSSELQSLADLRGKAVAFPAPNAFAASLLVRAQLAAQQIEIQPRYLKNHGNVYRASARAGRRACGSCRGVHRAGQERRGPAADGGGADAAAGGGRLRPRLRAAGGA